VIAIITGTAYITIFNNGSKHSIPAHCWQVRAGAKSRCDSNAYFLGGAVKKGASFEHLQWLARKVRG
jgi:hypothetical protein